MAAQLITVDACSKEPKTCQGGPHKGEQIWQVKDPAGVWASLYYGGPRPTKGQQFQVNITTREYQGKTYYDAHIAGPAPAQFAQAAAVHQLAQSIGQPQTAHQSAHTANIGPLNGDSGGLGNAPLAAVLALGKPSGKIAWADWAHIAETAWAQGAAIGMPPSECVAYVNTTLIAFSNGKLELPVKADPLAGSKEPGDDDPFDWADDTKT